MAKELKQLIESQVQLEESAWDSLEQILQKKIIARKSHFLREGDHCGQVGFIVKGLLRLYYLRDGEEITKDFNFENAFCGSYASFSRQEPSRFNIVAMEDTEVHLMGRDALYALFDRYPSLQKFGRLCVEHMFIKKELREASFLLDSAERRYQDLVEQYPDILQRLPLKYLASYLGLTAETLSRLRRKALEEGR